MSLTQAIRNPVALFLVVPVFVIGMFSPILGWLSSLIFLQVLSSRLDDNSRQLLGLFTVFESALVAASREKFVDPSDDFSNSYYWQFVDIGHYGLVNYLSERSTDGLSAFLEVGLLGTFRVLSVLCGELSPWGLMAVTSLILGFLFLLWLERHGLDQVPQNRKAFVIAVSLGLFSFGLGTQLMRQMYASVFLLFVISSNRFVGSIAWTILASSFHISALPQAIAIELIKRESAVAKIVAFALVLATAIAFRAVISGSDALEIVFDKALFYTSSLAEESNAFDLALLPVMVIVLALSFVPLAKKAIGRQWRTIILFYFVLYIAFVAYPFASFRAAQIIISVLLGYLAATLTSRLPLSLMSTSFVIIFIVRAVERVSTSLRPAGFRLWGEYEPFGIVPFYFFFN